MINFAKLSKVPPKRRMAAALRGFGFGNVRSTSQHLRGLGFSQLPSSTIEAARAAGFQAVASGGTVTLAPVVTRAPLTVFDPGSRPAIYVEPKPYVGNKLRDTSTGSGQTQVGDQERQEREDQERQEREDEQERERLALDEERRRAQRGLPRFAEGREEEYISPEDTEDADDDWSSYSGDSGGRSSGERFAEGTPGDGSAEPGAKKKGTGSKALAQSGGLVAQLSALPMPVKVIGGLAVAYVVWQALK